MKACVLISNYASSWAIAALLAVAVLQEIRIFLSRRASRNREELFQIVAENAADMIALVDMKGHRLYNSPAYTKILGYSAAELQQTSSFEQIHPEDKLKVLEAAREARASGVGRKLEYRVRHKNGSWRVLESVASAIRDQHGRVAKLVIVNRDITDRKEAEERADQTLLHDNLTGLPNQKLLVNRMERALAEAQGTNGKPFALLFIALDDFAQVQETYGPRLADALIVAAAKRLQSCLRSDLCDSTGTPAFAPRDPLLCRLRGHVNAVFIENISDPADAMRVSNGIQNAFRDAFSIESYWIRTSTSIGITMAASGHASAAQVLADAEAAMRRAQARGGGRCELYDELMHSRAESRLRLENELRLAQNNGEFRIHYQPIVELCSRRVVSLEALLRWQHPQQGLISPYKFLEAAEDMGMLTSVGEGLLAESLRQLASWQQLSPPDVPLSVTVNLSVREFSHIGLASRIRLALQKAGLSPGHLKLEITEDVLAANPKSTAAIAADLKKLGVRLILDDFGRGPCSIRTLQDFPFDELKLDATLIAEMLVDKRSRIRLELLISLAHKLNMTVAAEAIENVSQLEELRSLGCELGQGYLFSRAVEPALVEPMLRQQSRNSEIFTQKLSPRSLLEFHNTRS